jgi:hypothetical protein
MSCLWSANIDIPGLRVVSRDDRDDNLFFLSLFLVIYEHVVIMSKELENHVVLTLLFVRTHAIFARWRSLIRTHQSCL